MYDYHRKRLSLAVEARNEQMKDEAIGEGLISHRNAQKMTLKCSFT